MLNQGNTLQNLSMLTFRSFLEEAKLWDQMNSSSKTEDKEKFLQALNIQNGEITHLPSFDDVKRMFLKYSLKKCISKTKPGRKKWNKEEKEVLIWAVYYFSRIFNKNYDEMAFFYGKTLIY